MQETGLKKRYSQEIVWADSDFPSRSWTLRMDPQVTLSGKLQPIQVEMSLIFQTSRIYFKIRNHSPDDKMINRSLLFLDTPRRKKKKKMRDKEES